MRFFSPNCLLLLPVILVLGAALWLYCGREFNRRLAKLVAAKLRTPFLSHGALARKRLQLLLGTGALLALVLALSRPLAGINNGAARQHGVNVMIAVDGSKSMLVEDAGPPAGNRFELAQFGVESLVTSFDGDRAGLIMFGSTATLITPITFDTVSLRVMARGITPELVGRGGSSLAAVIQRAVTAFRTKAYQTKVLVIFSDGEETEGDAVVAAAQAFSKEGIRVFTVGVGSVEGGPIPLFSRDERRRLVRYGEAVDPSGQTIRSRLNPELLQMVAQAGGGRYVNLTEAKGDLREFHAHAIKPLAGLLEEIELKDLTEWFQLPLLIALGLILWEMLLPISAVPARALGAPTTNLAWSPRASPVVSSILLGSVVALSLGATPSARASVADARRLITKQQFGEAFALLQKELIAAPDDPFVTYNYAVGAYAAGKYSVAIPILEKLLVSYEPDVADRSALQLGNSYYRMGSEMKGSNNEGAIPVWEKALAAYARAPGADAAFNRSKTHGELLTLELAVAREKDSLGEAEARIAPERGIPRWREAIAYLDKALPLAAQSPLQPEIVQRKEAIGGKIYHAYFDSGDTKLRLAVQQHDTALARAIGLVKAAAKDFGSAQEMRPDEPAPKAGKLNAESLLEPWLVELGNQEYDAGVAAKRVSFNDAFAHWRKAVETFEEVLRKNTENPAAQAGMEKSNRAMHDTYVEQGDRQQQQADELDFPPEDRDKLFTEALASYESALAIEPTNEGTKAKVMAVGRKLTRVFIARGQEELATARKQEKGENLSDAIASAERSVHSFGKALRFEPDNIEAVTGRKEAEELLKKLRQLESRDRRKVLTHSKEMKNAEEMKDPGKLALKLLEYDKAKLSSKKQQNFSVPENRPLKDW